MTMRRSDSSFGEEVARFYESTLVPLIFEPYAQDLATQAKSLEPNAVLEIACGTGVVTRALATELPAGCEITATDLNQAMVAHAEQVGTTQPVTWQQADAMALPHPDDAFDVVVCQFGVMFFPDRVAAYREVRRVLRPGGTFLFNVWNGIQDNEFAKIVTDGVGTVFPSDPPKFLVRTPHGYGSSAEVEEDILAAGFAQCEVRQRDDVSRAATPDVVAKAYCQGTPLRNEIESRDPAGLEHATAVATAALRSEFGDGPIEGRISAMVVTADVAD